MCFNVLMPSLHLDPYCEVSGIYAVNPFDVEQILRDSLATFTHLRIHIELGKIEPWEFAHENASLDRDDFTMPTADNSILLTKRAAAHRKVYEKYGLELYGTDGMCHRFEKAGGAIVTKSMVQMMTSGNGMSHEYESLKQRIVHEIGHGVFALGHCAEIDCIMQEEPSTRMVQQGLIPRGFCKSHRSALAKFI